MIIQDIPMTASMETQLLFKHIIPKLAVDEQLYVIKLAIKQNPWLVYREEYVRWVHRRHIRG